MARMRRPDIPAYKTIQNSIAKRIQAGRLKPGDTVNSERELARIYRVSLMTARHALTELEREGLVERRRGAGTYVAWPRIHFNKLMSFTEQMATRGLRGRSRLLRATTQSGEPEVAARLNLAGDSPLLCLERLRLAADEPFALETCYLSADRFPGLARRPLQRDSLFAILRRDYATVIAHADEEIDATAADSRSADLLQVGPGAPLLRMRQLLYSSKGKAVLYVMGLYRSDRHTLLIRRFR